MGWISETIYSLDKNLIILVLIFVILLMIINLSLSKVFRRDKLIPASISLIASLLIVYIMGVMKLDLGGIVFNFGIPEIFLYIGSLIIILIGLTVLLLEIELSRTSITMGIALTIFSLTPLKYSKIVLLVVGLILLIGGLLLLFLKERNLKKNMDSSESIEILIDEAGNFNNWALKQKDSKIYGTKIYFLSYLYHKRGYPKGEKAVCKKLGISQRDFENIFNKYGLVN